MVMRIHPIREANPEPEPRGVELRSCGRLPLDGTVLFNIFNTDQPLRIGEIRNYSVHGVCFETVAPVRPGASLYLRIPQGPQISLHQNPIEVCRSISLAEVKWCRVIGDMFRVGVKFYD